MDWRNKVGLDVLQVIDGRPRGTINVIVQHTLGENLPRTFRGLRIKRVMPFVSAFTAELSPDEVAYLAKLKEVHFISSDRPVSSCMNITRPAVGADIAYSSGLNGQGVGVAVIDSGVYPHADLTGAIDAFVDLNDGETAPYDSLGHGTHVAGIILGRGRQNPAYKGIAPASKLCAIKVFTGDNVTSLGTILQAMGWVALNAARYNIRVVNLSLGAQALESFDQDPICQGSRLLWEQGIVVVASAGNEGRQGERTIRTPGTCPYCLTVGAVDDRRTLPRTDDTWAPFSSQGPTPDGFTKPDCVAPGVDVVSLRSPGSTLDAQLPQNRVGEHYFRLSGTSMAAPVVAGLAALILQRRPDLSPDDIKSIIGSTAEDKGIAATQQGMGYINAVPILRYLSGRQNNVTSNNLTVRFS